MVGETRLCPYCGIKLKNPYWRHIEEMHNEEYHSDKNTWIQLYKDYSALGMNRDVCIQVISQIFNRDEKIILSFLKKSKIV